MIKSTGSAFENFVGGEYTTVVEVDDRIFNIFVDLRYGYGEVAVRPLVIGISGVERWDANVVAGWK